MKPVKVLVTGGTGLVGSALLEELQNHPHKITLLTRTARNIDFTGKRKIKLVAADITDKSSLKRIKTQFDVIFHLAAAKRMFEKNHELKNININGLKNVLEAFCSSGRKTFFVFASSIDARVRNSDYARTKLEGEKIVRLFARNHPHTQFVNVRIGNVYSGDSVAEAIRLKSWRFRLLYHELGNKYIFPVQLKRLAQKLVNLIGSGKNFGKTFEIYDKKIRIKDIFETAPQKQLLGRTILSIWHFLGRLTKRGDLLVYLRSQK